MQMSGLRTFSMLLAGLLAAVSPASAETAEKLVGDQVIGYLKGNTVYVNIVPGKPFGDGGLSPFFYSADGRFAAKLPNSDLSGTWKTSDKASYCINIPKYGKTFCTDIFRTPEGIEHHSVGLKQLMGSVQRIVPGNAEKF